MFIGTKTFNGYDLRFISVGVEKLAQFFDEVGLIVAQGDDLRCIFFDSEKIIMFMPEFHDIRDMELLDIM